MKMLSVFLFVFIVPKDSYTMSPQDRENNLMLMQEGFEFQLASLIQNIPSKEIREDIVRQAKDLRRTRIPHVHLSSHTEVSDYGKLVPLSLQTRLEALNALAAKKEALIKRAKQLAAPLHSHSSLSHT